MIFSIELRDLSEEDISKVQISRDNGSFKVAAEYSRYRATGTPFASRVREFQLGQVDAVLPTLVNLINEADGDDLENFLA